MENELQILINETKLQKRIEEIAKQIMNDYEGQDLVFICVLKGGVFFTIDLAKKIKNNIRFEFIEVSSYEGTESTGKIKLNKDITSSVEGQNVIIVEDIIDTGRTLNYLVEHLKEKNPKSIEICTLLSKPSRRIIELEVKYIGFQIDDLFVIGYGLDDEQNKRNLPYIGYKE